MYQETVSHLVQRSARDGGWLAGEHLIGEQFPEYLSDAALGLTQRRGDVALRLRLPDSQKRVEYILRAGTQAIQTIAVVVGQLVHQRIQRIGCASSVLCLQNL